MPLSHQLVIVSNLSLVNLSNLSPSPILNQIFSHESHSKDTSQRYFQHHQHMPIPIMYQHHQHTIKRYVSQPCTKACIKPSTYTIPRINYVPQLVPDQTSTVYHTMCINHAPKPCINHAPKSCINHALKLYQTVHAPQLYQNCASTMHQNCTKPCMHHNCTKPCINHAPKLYQIVHQSCSNTCTT
jgi:hypothetical protein